VAEGLAKLPIGKRKEENGALTAKLCYENLIAGSTKGKRAAAPRDGGLLGLAGETGWGSAQACPIGKKRGGSWNAQKETNPEGGWKKVPNARGENGKDPGSSAKKEPNCTGPLKKTLGETKKTTGVCNKVNQRKRWKGPASTKAAESPPYLKTRKKSRPTATMPLEKKGAGTPEPLKFGEPHA